MPLRSKKFLIIALSLVVFLILASGALFLLAPWSLAPSSPSHLSTKTAKPKTNFSFLVFGDSGIGSDEQKKLASLMAKEAFDFILHTGDLAYSAGTTSQIQAYVLDIYKDLFEKHPFYPSLGNHDYGTDKGRPYLDTWDLPKQALNTSDLERYYSFNSGQAHFVSLDSNTPLDQNDSDSTTDMFDWLRADLASAKAKGVQWLVVYFHHPPFSSSSVHGEDTRAQEKLVPIFEKYHVDLVLNGHDHTYERTCPINLGKAGENCTDSKTGTVYVVTGGGGNKLYPFQSTKPWYSKIRESVHHFLKINVESCSLSVKAIDVSGKSFNTFTIEKCL